MKRFWLTEEIPVSRGFLIFAMLILVSGWFPESPQMNGLLGLYMIVWATTLIRACWANRQAWKAIRARVDHTHPWED